MSQLPSSSSTSPNNGSLLLSSQCSPAIFDHDNLDSSKQMELMGRHRKSKSHIVSKTNKKRRKRRKINRNDRDDDDDENDIDGEREYQYIYQHEHNHNHRRVQSDPINGTSNTNTKYNNYYSQIRFCRQDISTHSIYDHQFRRYTSRREYPENNIRDYSQFLDKYGFEYLQNNPTRKQILGRGGVSTVYKVHLKKNKHKKYAAKFSPYGKHNRHLIVSENKLLHKFGNGLYIKDIFDDMINHRMIFILPHGHDLKGWFNSYEIKQRFQSLNTENKELVLKKILFKILLNLKEVHDSGYIHHDLKPQNILVTRTRLTRRNKKRKRNELINDYDHESNPTEWINNYSFHIIDFGLTIKCAQGNVIALNSHEIRFGTMGYNAWELMKYNENRQYSHNIDLYALGITICELILEKHILRYHNNFKRSQQQFVYNELIDNFVGSNEEILYRQTLRLKCQHWNNHFIRQRGINKINGDESWIRSIMIKEIQYKTPYTTRFKNFVSNIIRDNPQIRISSVDEALNHDLFYNV